MNNSTLVLFVCIYAENIGLLLTALGIYGIFRAMYFSRNEVSNGIYFI